MTAPDLNELHDFYQPPPPSWVPQTIGWYVLFGLLCALALYFIAREVRRWLQHRYRRDALRELQSVPVNQLSEVLKRTAMVTWPRSQVASLTGQKWIEFLAAYSKAREFNSGPGNRIEDIALGECRVTSQDEQRLRKLASDWVRTHHV